MHIEASLRLTRQHGGSTPTSPPLNPVQLAQRQIVAVVTELTRLDHELHEIAEALPLAPDQCAMEDESVAVDVALWLRWTLRQVRGQALLRVIEQLRQAAHRTEEDQRHAFYEATRS